MVARMAPRLLWNRWRHGRALDVLVSHAPARGVGDREDPAHRGFQAIRRFLGWFAPAYHLHGHVHLYDRSQSPTIQFGATTVVNVFPYQVVALEPGPAPRPAGSAAPAPALGDPAPAPAARAEHLRPESPRHEPEPPR
jgi:hypothetical protein